MLIARHFRTIPRHDLETIMVSRKRSRVVRLTSAFIAVLLISLITAVPADAAVAFRKVTLDIKVTNQSVMAAVKVKANPKTKVNDYGIALERGNTRLKDLVKKTDVTISKTGTTIRMAKPVKLKPGKYTAWVYVNKPGSACKCVWKRVGSFKTFIIKPAGLAGEVQAAPIGDVPGFRQTFVENFKTAAVPGKAYSVYDKSIVGYGNVSQYREANVSAHHGVLDLNIPGSSAKVNPGTGAAVIFGPPESVWGQKYGRFEIRFKVVGGRGTGAAFMLWPSDRPGCPGGCWSDGEIDFPEGWFSSNIKLYQHTITKCEDRGYVYCGNYVSKDTGVKWDGWHTASIEWKPKSLRYRLDDKLIHTETNIKEIPKMKERWTLQVVDAQHGSKHAPGHVYVDWVSKYSLK